MLCGHRDNIEARVYRDPDWAVEEIIKLRAELDETRECISKLLRVVEHPDCPVGNDLKAEAAELRDAIDAGPSLTR